MSLVSKAWDRLCCGSELWWTSAETMTRIHHTLFIISNTCNNIVWKCLKPPEGTQEERQVVNKLGDKMKTNWEIKGWQTGRQGRQDFKKHGSALGKLQPAYIASTGFVTASFWSGAQAIHGFYVVWGTAILELRQPSDNSCVCCFTQRSCQDFDVPAWLRLFSLQEQAEIWFKRRIFEISECARTRYGWHNSDFGRSWRWPWTSLDSNIALEVEIVGTFDAFAAWCRGDDRSITWGLDHLLEETVLMSGENFDNTAHKS